MLCFSDLDRTIICSNKLSFDVKDKVSVENLHGEDISFISLKSINILQNILKNTEFIPTTTRSIEQYKRIKFLDYNIKFNFAIVSNGGYILKDNLILDSWNIEVEKLKKESENIVKMVELFKEYENNKAIKKMAVVDNNFFYIVIDEALFNYEYLDEYINLFKLSNWSVYKNGRKIYFMPREIRKENAIKYLIKELNEEIFYTLGDSIMDFGMLKIANKSYVPKHSDILNININDNLFVSNRDGLLGCEELLYKLHKDLEYFSI